MTTITRLAPAPTTCHQCGVVDAVAVCGNCGTERPALTALKNITAKLRALPRCAYYPAVVCYCDQRGACLPAA